MFVLLRSLQLARGWDCLSILCTWCELGCLEHGFLLSSPIEHATSLGSFRNFSKEQRVQAQLATLNPKPDFIRNPNETQRFCFLVVRENLEHPCFVLGFDLRVGEGKKS